MMASQEPLIAKIIPHRFKAKYDFHGELVPGRTVRIYSEKKDSLVVSDSGKEYLHLVSTNDNGREDIYLGSGDVKSINGFLVSFNKGIEGAVEFKKGKRNLFIKTPVEANYMTMATQATGVTKKDEFQPLALKVFYTIENLKLVVPEPLKKKKGNLIAYSGDKKETKMFLTC